MIWSTGGRRFLNKEVFAEPIPTWQWRERLGDDPLGSLRIPAVGIIANGPDVGQVLDIWLHDDGSDAETDAANEARRIEKAAERDLQQEYESALSKRIDEVVAHWVEDMAKKPEKAEERLFWCLWFGADGLRYRDDVDCSFSEIVNPLDIVWNSLAPAFSEYLFEVALYQSENTIYSESEMEKDALSALVAAMGISIADIILAAQESVKNGTIQ